LLVGVALTLTFGLFARWNGVVLATPVLQPLDRILWATGHFLKPKVFNSVSPPNELATGIPLPGYLLAILIPFWEGARVASRYAILAFIALAILAGISIQRLPRTCQYLILFVWLIEMLPRHTGSVILPKNGHPAHQWLAAQHLGPADGVLDISETPVMTGPETLLATLYDNVPTVGGTGSSRPEHTLALIERFSQDKDILSRPESSALLREYGVRYLLLHVRGDAERALWNKISTNPLLGPIGCFDPGDNLLWTYPMCLTEVIPDPQFNLLNLSGWSIREQWGIWAVNGESQAEWYAPALKNYHLTVQATPVCTGDKPQIMEIQLNGISISSYQWMNCELLIKAVAIPSNDVRVGRNRLNFHYSKAALPGNGDDRNLSVGFLKLRIDAEGAP
jgi:hypothetical protein